MLSTMSGCAFRLEQTWKPVFGGSRKHFCCFTRTFSHRTITAEVGKLGNRNAAEMPTIRASGRVEHGADRRQSGARAKAGCILRFYPRDSPASMSIHEEGTVGVIMP